MCSSGRVYIVYGQMKYVVYANAVCVLLCVCVKRLKTPIFFCRSTDDDAVVVVVISPYFRW